MRTTIATIHDPCGIDAEYYQKEIYLFAEEFAVIECLPDKVIELIGKLLTKAKLPYLEFGLAWYGDRPAQSCCGGTYVRIMRNGTLVEPKLVWPKNTKKK